MGAENHTRLASLIRGNVKRIVLMQEESGFKNLATSEKKAVTVRAQEIKEGQQRQEEIRKRLRAFGQATKQKLFKDRKEFPGEPGQVNHERRVRRSAPELKAVGAVLGERDHTAEICRDRDDQVEANPRDTETVPLKASIEGYFKRPVLPHVPDAWKDTTKTKAGYEIPHNRHCHHQEPLRSLETIETDFKALEEDIMKMLKEVTT